MRSVTKYITKLPDMEVLSLKPRRGMTEVASCCPTTNGVIGSAAQPRRGMTEVASRFNGWENDAKEKRAFRYATYNAVLSHTYGTPAIGDNRLPAIEMAGYRCPTPDGVIGGAAQPRRGMTEVASRFNGWENDAKEKRAFRYATNNGKSLHFIL